MFMVTENVVQILVPLSVTVPVVGTIFILDTERFFELLKGPNYSHLHIRAQFACEQ